QHAHDAEVQTHSRGTTSEGTQATPHVFDGGNQTRVRVKHQNVQTGSPSQLDKSVQAKARTDHNETQTSLHHHDRSVQTADRLTISTGTQAAGTDSVTIVSHAPQMFGWPSTGQPMRIFDRSIAITYSKESGSVSYQFFGKDKGGVFLLPMLNEGVTTGYGKKNLVMVGNMLDPDKQKVKFDLQAYRGDKTGSTYLADPNHYTA
ncbi:hypothetical protein P0D69_44230, partial [Paraburkholderia sediminicola]